ncbi:uncharacterized protein LOC132919213 [Rhopalosiphum padi]|uniref:uncharacterized protein LOC132919213 n=1 Tax=Rhopalosiphum padi TaxID=40932 RepID=UPI00298EBF89|nr:uncharacterized protein LOC132919213 [Rhopalosiphum padi]
MSTCGETESNMMKITIATLVQVSVFFVMQVSVEPCNDKYIKDMIVNVCGMVGLKRSFDDNSNPGLLFGLSIRRMLDDTEREFEHLFGDTAEAKFQLKKSNENKPKELNVTPLQLPIHLPGFKDRSRHVKRRDDVGKATIMKREVMAKLKECCVKKCTPKDLRHICEKK